jgi:mannosylglycerate hydrolase
MFGANWPVEPIVNEAPPIPATILSAYLPATYGIDCLGSDFKYSSLLSGTALRNADPAVADEDFFMIDSRRAYDPNRLAEAAAAARETTDATLLKSHRLYMNGTDFSTAHPELSKMVRDLNLVSEDTRYVSGSLADYARALGKNVDRGRLRVPRGELRDGPACDCSANALSARIYLKL